MLPNVAVAIICEHERHYEVLHGVHSSLVVFFLTLRSFWFSLIVFTSVICLNDVFLRNSKTGVALNTSPKVLLMFKNSATDI